MVAFRKYTDGDVSSLEKLTPTIRLNVLISWTPQRAFSLSLSFSLRLNKLGSSWTFSDLVPLIFQFQLDLSLLSYYITINPRQSIESQSFLWTRHIVLFSASTSQRAPAQWCRWAPTHHATTCLPPDTKEKTPTVLGSLGVIQGYLARTIQSQSFSISLSNNAWLAVVVK